MTRKLVAAAVAAAVVIVAPLANAKPVNELGHGCLSSHWLESSHVHTQTFQPTFSVLKKVTFALYFYPTSAADAVYLVALRYANGNFIIYSNYGVLDADTTYDDAVRGGTVTFTFANGIAVTPNTTYQLELFAYNVPSETVYACTGTNFYSGGDFLNSPGSDLEFAAAGGGKAK